MIHLIPFGCIFLMILGFFPEAFVTFVCDVIHIVAVMIRYAVMPLALVVTFVVSLCFRVGDLFEESV